MENMSFTEVPAISTGIEAPEEDAAAILSPIIPAISSLTKRKTAQHIIAKASTAPINFFVRSIAILKRRFFLAAENSFSSFFAIVPAPFPFLPFVYAFLLRYLKSGMQTAALITAETSASVIPIPVMVAITVPISASYACSFAAE